MPKGSNSLERRKPELTALIRHIWATSGPMSILRLQRMLIEAGVSAWEVPIHKTLVRIVGLAPK